MPQLFTNNAWSFLNGGITAVATSITLSTGEGARFPTPTGGDYFLLTLIGLSEGNESSWEIVKVTARATDVLTVVRAQEGTSGFAWLSGTRVELRMTSATAGTFEVAYNWGDHSTGGYLTTVSFGDLTGKPTTIAGFGITDCYTDAEVDAAIAALVDSSPAALDTLNELAAALGDDANFSTTMTNALAGKAASSHGHGWSDISSTPTTMAGYGITDGGSMPDGTFDGAVLRWESTGGFWEDAGGFTIADNGNVGIYGASTSRSLGVFSNQSIVANFESNNGVEAQITFSGTVTNDDTSVRIGASGDYLTMWTGGAEQTILDDFGNFYLNNGDLVVSNGAIFVNSNYLTDGFTNFRTLTQATYDGLGTPDANTIYFING